jgi:phage tail protein X
MQYLTRAGDRLDLICEQHYQRRAQAVETVLKANPGLAEQGPILPAGLRIELPDLPAAVLQTQPVRLWE